MDLDTLSWDADIAEEMGIPLSMLPEIRSSSEVYGPDREPGVAGRRADRRHPRRPAGRHVRAGLPVRRGSQEHLRHRQLHAAQHRHEKVQSKNGLLTTVCYKIGDQQPVYALEGSIAVIRVAGAVAAGQPRADLHRSGDRGPGEDRRRQRRRLLRPGVLRPVRAALALRRPGCHRRADPVRQQGAPGPRGPGGHRLPDAERCSTR